MTARKSTKHIVLHCSATRPNMDIGVKDIRRWHQAKGWDDVGYHYVLRRNGRVEKGRAEQDVGAHVARYNASSLGICLVGGVNQNDFTKPENNFTAEQWIALRDLLAVLIRKYPDAKVLGHRDFPGVNKACPCFDARQWAAKNGFPS
jgi:N-acetyl-anhydromuramyl-L-alanine amidase AmpD